VIPLEALVTTTGDVRPADPYLSLGGGRSRFRVEDLLALVAMVRELEAP